MNAVWLLEFMPTLLHCQNKAMKNEQTEYELITNLLSEEDVLCKHTGADGSQSFMMEILYCNGSMYGKKRQSDNAQQQLIGM